MTIKILLVDDHTVVRSGLSKFLMVNKDLKLVGEASDGAEAVQMVSLHKPDIVLMDLMMPGVDGITATREIHTKYPQVKVIALTSFAEQNMVQGALQAGAIGYLQKNVTAKELGNAIRSACIGKMTLSTRSHASISKLSRTTTNPRRAIDRTRTRRTQMYAGRTQQ